MRIKEIMEEIHEVNVKNGFWEDKETKNTGEVLMLITSELAEALEADRKGHYAMLDTFFETEPTREDIEDYKIDFENYIKNSFEDELADTVIRLFDFCQAKGIDLETHIRLKLEYNKLRPYKHGKKY